MKKKRGTILLVMILAVSFMVFASERPSVIFVLDKKGFSFKLLSSIYVPRQGGEIYVCDVEAQQIRIFNPDGTERSSFAAIAPIGVAVDRKGNLYVLETGEDKNNFIGVYDYRFQKLDVIKINGAPYPLSGNFGQITIDENDKLYILDQANRNVICVSTEGNYLRHFGKFPEEENGKAFPGVTGITVDSQSKRLYVVDAISSRIYVYKLNGKFIFEFGKGGGITGELSQPCSVAVDNSGNINVLDKMRHTIVVYDSVGKYLYEIGGKGVESGWFNFPRMLCIDSENRIYVLEPMICRVQALKVEKKKD